MSLILTDQGFVEIGGELTHWDRGYIKKGHKWITRKMKNGKWVYTYKDAKADANKYRDQARINQYIGNKHSNHANYYNNESKNYDRLGLDELKIKYFNTEISKVVIPVLPGRTVSLLVESAAMNEKLKLLGHNAAKDFIEKVDNKASNKKDGE